MSTPDLTARIGDVTLPNPVLAASGCFGTGAEKLGTVDAARLGGVVTKSMSARPWPGNPGPRLVPVDGGGMLNSVGLQNPGVDAWCAEALPVLEAAGVRVIASIWGRSRAELRDAAAGITDVADRLVAVEVNLSCPNLESPDELIAHDPGEAAAAIAAVVGVVGPLPVWAKLSPNVPTNVKIGAAVVDAGAGALVLTNTLIGMHIGVPGLRGRRRRRRPHLAGSRPTLGAQTGGLSGPPLRPVAIRMVFECHRADPAVPIVGVGGISRAEHVIEFLAAGASAVEVGAAHLVDPHAGVKIVRALPRVLERAGASSVREVIGVAHESKGPTK